MDEVVAAEQADYYHEWAMDFTPRGELSRSECAEWHTGAGKRLREFPRWTTGWLRGPPRSARLKG